MSRWPTFRIGALEHRNFRLFIVGQFVSLCGSWMQTVALSWLVLELTDSTLKTGLVATLGSLPVLLLTLYGGVIADRVNKRRWLMGLQTLFLIEALVIGVLTVLELITVPWIYALALFSGLVSAFEIPIRQAYLVEMVGKNHLMSAIALNSTAFNLSRVVGPAFAGFVNAAFGSAACFFVNAASFLAVLIGLYRLDPAAMAGAPSGRRAGIKAGLRHVFEVPFTKALVTLTTTFTLFGASLIAILPAFARKELGAEVGGYGALMSAFGVGAAGGALTLAWIGQRFPRERVALTSGIGLGASLILLGSVHVFSVTVVVLMLTGLTMALNAIMTNTILQTSAPDYLRGQIVGLYSFIVIGLAPFGSAQAAWIGEQFGPSRAILIGGAVCLVAALAVSWRQGLFKRTPIDRGEAP
ncbi:MAG: MFS transporter [Gemmatimonadales bacterium]